MRWQETLWRAANKLRGQMDAAAYKHVVLALVFLRHAGAARGGLRVPAEARWDNLVPGSIDAAMEALERANPPLRGALPRGLDGSPRLGELLDLLADLEFEGSKDSLGRIYEYFLERFARAEGRRGGQFYTPSCVVRLLAALLGPLDGSLYDPCCGTGGMFVQGSAARESFGQESNPQTWRLARMNLALHGIGAELGPGPADSFLEDLHAGRRADFVLANPPFNQSEWGAEMLRDDARWRYGPPPARNANFAWLQHILAHLAPQGIAAVVLANGSLSSAKGGEDTIRRRLVEDGWVDGIVALPPQLFLTTQIPACIWVLSHARPERTLLVDARGMGFLSERTRRSLLPQEIERIAGWYRRYRAGEDPRVPGLCAAVEIRKLSASDHRLSPARYLDAAPVSDEGPSLRELQEEWQRLADEAERLTKEIRESGLGPL